MIFPLVLIRTGDGLAACQMFRLHAPKNSEIVHRTTNPFATVYYILLFEPTPPSEDSEKLLRTVIYGYVLARCMIKTCDL